MRVHCELVIFGKWVGGANCVETLARVDDYR